MQESDAMHCNSSTEKPVDIETDIEEHASGQSTNDPHECSLKKRHISGFELIDFVKDLQPSIIPNCLHQVCSHKIFDLLIAELLLTVEKLSICEVFEIVQMFAIFSNIWTSHTISKNGLCSKIPRK